MRRQYRKREEWLQLIKEFESRPGISHREFALDKGLNIRTFRKWLYLFRQEQAQGYKPGDAQIAPFQFVELVSSAPPTIPTHENSTPHIPEAPLPPGRLYFKNHAVLELETLPPVSYLSEHLRALER